MGAQWKHSIRQVNNNKKGQIVGKLTKEIIVAAKLGGADPASNFRLRGALEDARKNSVPRDTIERCIKRGAGLLDDPIQYETIVYEGFAPHQVPVIVECLTENRNRTASDVRVLFRKGQLGASGSVMWMFDRKGVIEAQHPDKNTDAEVAAIEANADTVEVYAPTAEDLGEPVKPGIYARFHCAVSDLDGMGKTLTSMGFHVMSQELAYIVKNPVELSDAAKQEVNDFLGEIDDNDDVHRIYVGLK
jgi:YebC/PmpR family DNA-binding regulatory protein